MLYFGPNGKVVDRPTYNVPTRAKDLAKRIMHIFEVLGDENAGKSEECEIWVSICDNYIVPFARDENDVFWQRCQCFSQELTDALDDAHTYFESKDEEKKMFKILWKKCNFRKLPNRNGENDYVWSLTLK